MYFREKHSRDREEDIQDWRWTMLAAFRVQKGPVLLEQSERRRGKGDEVGQSSGISSCEILKVTERLGLQSER